MVKRPRKIGPPRIHVFQPPHVDDVDVIHVPVKRRVASQDRLLAKDVTAAEGKSLLDADADRLEPKVDGRERKPVPGYSNEARRAAYQRASKAVRVQSEKLKENRLDRVIATKAEKEKWNKAAKPLWETCTYKSEVAAIMAERTGATYSTMYRSLRKPK